MPLRVEARVGQVHRLQRHQSNEKGQVSGTNIGVGLYMVGVILVKSVMAHNLH